MRQLLVALAAVLVTAGAAQAHVQQAQQGSKTQQLRVRIAHDRGVIAAVDRQAKENGSAMFLEWRVWLTRQWHARDLIRAQAALVVLTRPPHYAGWLCIHRLEGSWQDDGAPYYGGLQMHEGWGGVYHANLISPLAQMWLAEREAAKNGFSYAYMKGQWPNTFPPCAGHF